MLYRGSWIKITNGENMLDFARQPLLNKEKEADLKSKMEPLWAARTQWNADC